MSKTRFKLQDTAIVSAINPSVQSQRGVVWEPVEVNDVLEAEALERIGIAKRTNEEPTTDTYAERERAKREAKENPPISGASIDAIKQADGTFRDSFGRQVNQDGTLYDPNRGGKNSNMAEVAKGTVADIEEDLATGQYSAEDLAELEKLEKSGQKRKGVLDLIAQYRSAE